MAQLHCIVVTPEQTTLNEQADFVALPLHQVRARLRAHADPIQTGRRLDRAVGLDRYFEAGLVQRGDRALVELQQRLSARADDQRVLTSSRIAWISRPSVPTNSVSQNGHTADSRSFSWPDHRLQPAKRRNTAGRPV